jgi:osmotically inducible protein OsmC
MVDGAPRITKVELVTRGEVPGIDQTAFEKAADSAKQNCPVSKALQGNVELKLEAKLV